ncbi:hypothetical protein GCM10009744_03130 [Kribbella alba]|uniref:Uncharacterized protein n=1 Tax=Kribbella alba TaxID=190197 RepID=A0ABN2EVZ6_9ACTN
MAGPTAASVPVLILYIFVQRYVIEGVARSGIKTLIQFREDSARAS